MGHVLITIKWHGLGYAPALIGPDGRLLSDVLAWIVSEKNAGKSDSTLYREAHAICQFADFWEQYHQQTPLPDLYRACFKSLVVGDVFLGWNGVNVETATKALEYINRFADWAADQAGTQTPNPIVEEHQGWVKTLARLDKQKRTSMLGHLIPATRAAEGIVERREIDPARSANRNSGSVDDYKAMMWDDYMTLLRHEKNPRNLFLWLILGAGGIRISEALHLYVQDVSETNGEARVLLTDPRWGDVTIQSLTGEKTTINREAYLKQNFGLTTRDQQKYMSTQYAGWKGMRMHNGKAMTAWIIWLHPDFGKLAWATHSIYLKARRLTQPKHPFYFVNLDHNVGGPLTFSNANGLLRDACARLNVLSAQNLHSLRHLFGDILHNRGGIEIDKVQVAMRHKSSASTEIYTKPLEEMVRERLKKIDALRPKVEENTPKE